MTAARAAMVAPTVFAGLRLLTTTFVYDDAGRVASTIVGPAYTPEDRALLLGLTLYEDSICDGCGQPKDVAWHSDMDGWYEAEKVVCHGCTALRGEEHGPTRVVDTRPPGHRALPPFKWGSTTTPASDSTSGPTAPSPREESL